MNRKLYKAAYNRVLEKKYFYRHTIVFVIGNFILFFMSLGSWTPAIYYLLTLVWMRVLAIHFKNAYPEVITNFQLINTLEEDKAIEKERKRLKKIEKTKAKLAAKRTKQQIVFPLEPAFAKATNKKYEENDLV